MKCDCVKEGSPKRTPNPAPKPCRDVASQSRMRCSCSRARQGTRSLAGSNRQLIAASQQTSWSTCWLPQEGAGGGQMASKRLAMHAPLRIIAVGTHWLGLGWLLRLSLRLHALCASCILNSSMMARHRCYGLPGPMFPVRCHTPDERM